MRSSLVAAAILSFAVSAARAEEHESAPVIESLNFANQEIGANVGIQVDAVGLATGGLHVGGEYLYRLADSTWFDGEASFSFGGGGPSCYLGRDQNDVCNPGGVGGVGFQLAAAVRWVLLVPKRRQDPLAYAKFGVAIHINTFPDDSVTGLGIPLLFGGGGRYRIGKGVSLMSEVDFLTGPAWYGKGIGTVGTLQIEMEVGVEIALD